MSYTIGAREVGIARAQAGAWGRQAGRASKRVSKQRDVHRGGGKARTGRGGRRRAIWGWRKGARR